MAVNDTSFNVYVGSDCGILKGVYFGGEEEAPMLKNFHSFSSKDKLTKKIEIVSLNWISDTDEKELLVGFSNNTAKIYNPKLKVYTLEEAIPLDGDKHGSLASICGYESGDILVGTTKGSLIQWNPSDEGFKLEISTGSHMAKFRRCTTDNNIIATGGKETELQLWNLNSPKPEVPIFKARNVPHDFLDLRVPVWVQEITFLPESTDTVAICTRHGQVRLYDTRSNNRPVLDMQYLDHPLMAISTASSNNRHVLVGSSKGTLGLIDLRNTKGSIVRQFNGYVGGVRSISAHPTLPFFTSCGLDRHLYLHHINEKNCRKRLYLKSSLQCVVMSKSFSMDHFEAKHGISHNISADTLPIQGLKSSKVKSKIDYDEEEASVEVDAVSVQVIPRKKKKKHV